MSDSLKVGVIKLPFSEVIAPVTLNYGIILPEIIFTNIHNSALLYAFCEL